MLFGVESRIVDLCGTRRLPFGLHPVLDPQPPITCNAIETERALDSISLVYQLAAIELLEAAIAFYLMFARKTSKALWPSCLWSFHVVVAAYDSLPSGDLTRD